MSNARSPREVCSTTIGTSGLIALALFRVYGGNPLRHRTGRAAGGGDGPSLAMGPPGLGRVWGGLDGLRRVDDQVDRLAHRDVLSQCLIASAGAGLLERSQQRLVARRLLAGLSRRLADRVQQLLVGYLDALALDDRGERRLAPQRGLGLGLGLDDQLLGRLVDELEVLLGVESLGLEAVAGRVPHLVGLAVD